MAGRTLVAYQTKSGASETYAKIIAETLKKNGIGVDLVNLGEKDADITHYDNIVVGTGVRMGMVYGRWKKVLKQKSLAEKKLFMFLSSGMEIEEPGTAVDKLLKPIIAKYRLSPASVGSFPGFIPEKWIEEGKEKETVKPELARAWAMEIAGIIGGIR